MEKFHHLDWEGKIDCVEKFLDSRYSYFGKRIIYEEAPDKLELKVKKEIKKLIHSQIFSPNNEKWNTFYKTNKEILNINNGKSIEQKNVKKLTKDFEQFLKKLEDEYN